MKIEQIFILAAGRGSRMMPLTADIPKPLVKINNISMLDRILYKINQLENIKKIVINGHYLSDMIEDHIKKIADDRIIFSKEDVKMETGGGLINALNFFDKNKPILIINGDIVWKGNILEQIIKEYDVNNTDILLGLKRKEEFFGYEGNGDFKFSQNSDQLIKNDKKKEGFDFVFTGIEIFHPRIINNLKLPNIPFSLSYFFTNSQDKNIRLKGTKLEGEFFHIGTVKDLKKYQNRINGY